MTTELSFVVHDVAPLDASQLIDAGLGAANEESAPIEDVRRLSCFAHLPGGEIVGGAIGRTWGSCCEIQQLWVERGHRRQGIATRLLQEIERKARERGCSTFFLETFSFQAPPLYRKLGYEVHLEIPGFPDDIVKYVMLKTVGGDDGR